MTTPEEPAEVPAEEPTWFGAAIDRHLSEALGRLFDSGKATVADTTQQQRGNPARPPEVDVERQTRDAQDIVEQTAKRVMNLTTEQQEAAAHEEDHKRIRALKEAVPEAERRIERIMGWRA